MSSETSRSAGEVVPVKFSRLSRRGIILGLSTTQLVTLGIGVLTLVGAFYAGGGMLIAYTAPIWVLSAALTWIPVAGRPVVEWVPVVAWWGWRATGEQLLYRRRIVAPRPASTLALPGDLARLREYTDPETGAGAGAGMIHDPHHATLTVVCEVSHPAFVLLDPGEQERRVTSWGRVLATVCRSGRIATLQVLESTLPDSGTGLAEWWAEHGTADDSWAATTYAELIDRAGPAGERHATTISLSLDMKAAARQIRTAGGHLRGASAVLRQEMGTLRAADLAPSGWLTPGKIAVILRSAYDPAIAPTLERHGELGQSLSTAGPVAVTETWAGLRTDTGHHAVLWISEWPRSMVYPGFLAPVLLSTGIQRAFSLLYTPLRTDQAVRDIRKKKVEHISDAAQRRKIGQIEDASQTAEYTDVLQQEADLTSGHGLLRVTGLISISAPTSEELDAAVSQIEQAAIQASCETRRLVGQQAAAFTAAAVPQSLTGSPGAAGAPGRCPVTDPRCRESTIMPTFYDPAADAAEASEALRGLAHASHTFEHPEDLYPVIGDLISGVRSLRQVLDQLANAHITHHTRAADDDDNALIGASTALDAADELHQAATVLDGVQNRLDTASQYAGGIAWPAATADAEQVDTGRRWISFVFLQGEDADEVLDLIDRDGIDAGLEHLKSWGYGEETTGAALENGHVYDLDQLPTSPLDLDATVAGYRMVYNPQMGHFALYRQHTIPAEDRLDTTPVPASAAVSGIGPLDGDAATSAAAQARWVEVTRVTGAGANRVFGILTTLGHVDAIDHLAQWDHGDDGPKLDALPTAPGVQMLESGKYALTVDTARREFALYRHDTTARPSRGAGRSGPELLTSYSSLGMATPSRERKESGRTGGTSWFAHPGVEAVKRERGLGR